MTASPNSFEITPRGDYSLEQGASFIGAWHRAASETGDPEGHLHLAFLTDRGWSAVGVCLRQDSRGHVLGRIYGETLEPEAVARQVERILSLDVDGRGWPQVAERDHVVARLQRMFPGFRPVNWSNAYEAAAWCVISSRISMRQGQGVKDRMSRELGQSIDVHGHVLWTFPAPERLAHLEKFPGLFGRKVEYLNALGRAALTGEVDTETLRSMPREEALRSLQRLPGIGTWGSELCVCGRSLRWTSFPARNLV
jgi:DNA-3-methyladenine glycosylase II